MANDLRRMWVNQPSTLQPYHALHGINVLAQPEYGSTMRIWFLSGDCVSQQICRSALSDGWQPNGMANARPSACQGE